MRSASFTIQAKPYLTHYELRPSLTAVRKDGSGNFLDTVITFAVYKDNGDGQTAMLTTNKQFIDENLDICIAETDDYLVDVVAGHANNAVSMQTSTKYGSRDKLTFRLEKGDYAAKVYDTKEIGVMTTVQGDIGPMGYLAGIYTDKEYTRTQRITPIVNCKVTGSTYEYWYLEAMTNRISGQNVAPSDAQGNPWKPAPSLMVVIAEMVFANFAKMGGLVVSGDCMLSKYGTLWDDNNGEITLDSNGEYVVDQTTGEKEPGYIHFNDIDSNGVPVEDSKHWRFDPVYWVEMSTGRSKLGDVTRLKVKTLTQDHVYTDGSSDEYFGYVTSGASVYQQLPNYIFVSNSQASSPAVFKQIILPPPSECEGVRVEIFGNYNTSNKGPVVIRDSTHLNSGVSWCVAPGKYLQTLLGFNCEYNSQLGEGQARLVLFSRGSQGWHILEAKNVYKNANGTPVLLEI